LICYNKLNYNSFAYRASNSHCWRTSPV